MISVFGSTGNYVGSLQPMGDGKFAAIDRSTKRVLVGSAARGADRLRYLAGQSLALPSAST
jgi:hypothetical protein